MTSNGKDFDGPILECKDLCISYFTRAGEIPAVVDFRASSAAASPIRAGISRS
jgi:hypothetical protein